MALAFLCSKLRKLNPDLKVVDHPLGTPYGFVVDHKLREGSGVEAQNVARELKALGLKAEVVKVGWRSIIGDGNPNDLPNIETLARQLRYRRLAMASMFRRMTTLFTAHHEDDQYETVLMRLLSGHGYRGLQGMRPATDVPECYDLHGVYQSGLIDDQRHHNPLYNMVPTKREAIVIKRHLRWEMDPAMIKKEFEAGLRGDSISPYLSEYDAIAKGSKRAPPLPPLDLEDGGIMLYRPLLSFSKERLVATCLENKVPWFEDHTNADQTLTMRNAVRHMWKNPRLPVALQKPAVLQLAAQCRARVLSEEVEAARLLNRVLVHEFGSNAGTLVVTLPRISLPTPTRRSSRSLAARQRRISHYRHTAALLIRRLLSIVTPERELTQPPQLTHLITMLFPTLADPGTPPPEPKPYVICGVHFIPLHVNPSSSSYPLRWLLTRAPHVSNLPSPSISFPGITFARRRCKRASAWKMPDYMEFQLYDGRYWVGIKNRLPCNVVVAPFEMEHHKPFREGLGDDRIRKDLSAMLKRYAPSKIRYALPGVYATVDVSRLLKGGEWWPSRLELEGMGGGGSESGSGGEVAGAGAGEDEELEGEKEEEEEVHEMGPEEAHLDEEEDPNEDPNPTNGTGNGNGNGTRTYPQRKHMTPLTQKRLDWEIALKAQGTMQLLALPTLGVALPGFEDWVGCEVRYRKVDAEVLRMSKIGGDCFGRREFRERVRWVYWRARRRREGRRRGGRR